MTRTNHDDFDGMAVGWALHALEPAEEQVFAEHLVSCGRCQQLVSDSEEALGDLAYDVPLVDPPPQVLDRIRHATGASEAMPVGPRRIGPSPTVVPLRRRASLGLPRWAAPAIAAGLVLVALLGWNVALQGRVDQAQRTATQRQNVIAELGRSNTRAVLTDNTDLTVGYVVQRGEQVEIVTGGLAANDNKRSTYVLWAIQGSGKPPQAVGTFDVVRDTMDVRVVSGTPPAPDTFSGFAVSKEPGRGIPQRPTAVVATGVVLS